MSVCLEFAEAEREAKYLCLFRPGPKIGPLLMTESLSQYELQRLEHIRRNHEMLVRLGLAEDKAETPAKAPKKPRAKAPPPLPETLRRSSRVKQVAPVYTHEVIDKFGEDMDRQCEPGAKRRKLSQAEAGEEEEEARVRAEIAESTVNFLREAREAMNRYLTSEDGDAPLTADGWRDEAVRRWGELAGGGPRAAGRDWEAFVTSRLSKPPPPSPEPLLQEFYAADMSQLLCCCVLMSRTPLWARTPRLAACYRSTSSRVRAPWCRRLVVGDQTPLHLRVLFRVR